MPTVYSYVCKTPPDTEWYPPYDPQRVRAYAAEDLPDLAWGGHFADDPAALPTAFGSRPAGTQLERSLRWGDWLLLPGLSSAFEDPDQARLCLKAWLLRGIGIELLDSGVAIDPEMGQFVWSLLEAMDCFAQEYACRIVQADAIVTRQEPPAKAAA
jgi:hypothetical protein